MATPINYGDIITEVQMTPEEFEYVQNLIKEMPETGTIAEWGSGGSTCLWIDALGPKQKLISVEHTENWYNRVSRGIKKHFGDVSDKFTFHHIPEEFIEHGYASLIEEHPCGTDKYIFPNDENFFDADIFFIDGIARAACAMTVLAKARKKTPVVLIHDYVGRENWYSWASQFFTVEIVAEPTLARLHWKD